MGKNITSAHQVLQSIFVGLLVGVLAALYMLMYPEQYPDWECLFMPGLMAALLVYCALVFSQGESKPPLEVHHGFNVDVPLAFTANGKVGVRVSTVSEDQWRRACKYLVEHKYNFSEISMRKVGIKREQYKKFRQELIERQVIRWKNPKAEHDDDAKKAGVTTTLPGAAIVRYNAK